MKKTLRTIEIAWEERHEILTKTTETRPTQADRAGDVETTVEMEEPNECAADRTG